MKSITINKTAKVSLARLLISWFEKDFDIKLLAAKKPNQTESVFSAEVMLFGISFGLFGALTNYFLDIPLYGHFSLYFGQIFVFLCLLAKGLNAGFIAAAISALALVIKQDDPFLFFILASETFAVHMFLRKGRALLFADALYWLTIGIPLTLILLALTSPATPEIFIISSVTIGINGVFSASVAALIHSFVPLQSPYQKYRVTPPKFATVIFSLCMLTVTLPTIAISLVFAWQNTQQKEQEIADTLARKAQQIAYLSETFINNHLSATETLSSTLSKSNFSLPVQAILDATAENHTYFESMLISDVNGSIEYATPIKFDQMRKKDNGQVLRNQDYFKSAKNTLQPQLSEASLGVGFGNDEVITVSAPIVSNGQFLGISQGAIKLSSFADFKTKHIDESALFHYVITDKTNNVIFASSALNLPTLSQFSYKLSENLLIKQIPELIAQGKPYLYYKAPTMHGWNITVLSSPQIVTRIISRNFYIFAISLLITLFVFSLIANYLSQRLTMPLVHLADNFSDTSQPDDIEQQAEVSVELVKLTRNLISSRDVMLNFQQQLHEQVQDKTKELKLLNQQLYNLSQKDGLTDLLNRSGFDGLAKASFQSCVRNNIPVSMVLIDIDDFKIINDTYGHPFGDKCIVSAAKTLNQHCKRNTDLMGRYGGEEFIIFLSGGNIQEHHELSKSIHKSIQVTQIIENDIAVKMTISVGVSSLDTNFGMTYEGLVKSADEQLYKSKRTGKNKISIYIQ